MNSPSLRTLAVVAVAAALSACGARSRSYVPAPAQNVVDQVAGRADVARASELTLTLRIHNATKYALHQQKAYGWCIARTPTSQIPAGGSQEQTLTVDTSSQRCRDQAMFLVVLSDPSVKHFITYDFSIFGAGGTAPGIRIDHDGFGGFCPEASLREPFTLRIVESTAGCVATRRLGSRPATSREFSVTVANSTEKKLVGLALTSFCMSATLGGPLAAGATTTQTVRTFGRSDICNDNADFVTYYWEPGISPKYLAAIEWLFEGPNTVKVYARGYDGYCAAKVAETHVKLFKATDGRCNL